MWPEHNVIILKLSFYKHCLQIGIFTSFVPRCIIQQRYDAIPNHTHPHPRAIIFHTYLLLWDTHTPLLQSDRHPWTEYLKTTVGTVDNHGNTEIMEAVIFVKCRDFAKMPCFFVKMPQFYVFTRIFCFSQHTLKFIV